MQPLPLHHEIAIFSLHISNVYVKEVENIPYDKKGLKSLFSQHQIVSVSSAFSFRIADLYGRKMLPDMSRKSYILA